MPGDDDEEAMDSSSWPDTSRPVIGYGQQGYDADFTQPSAGPQGSPPSLPNAVLYLDDESHRAYPLRVGGNIIGRGRDADFRLPEPAVSRRHLEITWDGRSAVLADLGSTNGTTVNGTPVQTWQLADGDVLLIGRVTLVFRFGP